MLRILIDENIFDSSIAPKYVFTKLEAYLYIVITCERQSYFCTKIYTLAKKWNWSRNKVRKFLDDLVNDNRFGISKDDENNLHFIGLINNKKDIEEDKQKDSEKGMVNVVDFNVYEVSKDSVKDSEKDSAKDTSKFNIDLDSINSILDM